MEIYGTNYLIILMNLVQIPLKDLDVMRRIYTDLDSAAENTIDEVWTEDGSRKLSSPWWGEIAFHLLRPPAPPGYRWVAGRMIKVQ